MVLDGLQSFFVKKQSDANDIIYMIEFLVDNIFVECDEQKFQWASIVLHCWVHTVTSGREKKDLAEVWSLTW